MSAPVWLSADSVCPDCGKVSLLFAKVVGELVELVYIDPVLGRVPECEVVPARVSRPVREWACGGCLGPVPRGWRRLWCEPALAEFGTQ